MNILKWLNKKGISTDILVIVLLIIGLAIAVILFITFGSSGKSGSVQLFNLTYNLKKSSGLT
jgi:predicted PurR-regulated permease PerM